MWDKFAIFGIFGILVCVTWRLSYMLVNETGPFRIFVILRSMFGIAHDADGLPVSYPDNMIAELLSCVYCTSVWVGLVVTLVSILVPVTVLMLISMPFALSAGAIMIDRFVSGR